MNIPACLAHLPRHGSGLPIPFVTGYEADGTVNFRSTNTKNHTLAHKFQLCGICGKYIPAPPYIFSVGPVCLEGRCVFEPPMHAQCARAAFTLCPYLSRDKWARSARPGNPLYAIEDVPPKPPRVGLAFAPSYRPLKNPDNGFLYAILPAAEFPVEWWVYVDGILVPQESPA